MGNFIILYIHVITNHMTIFTNLKKGHAGHIRVGCSPPQVSVLNYQIFKMSISASDTLYMNPVLKNWACKYTTSGSIIRKIIIIMIF